MTKETNNDLEIERRRSGIMVKAALGFIMIKDLFTVEELDDRHALGIGTPLDLVPIEYWRHPDMPFSRFGEEALGPEF